MNILNVGYASTNYYVLADSRPRLLVDVGWPGTLGRLQDACRRTGLALADIPYLLITHYHPDHAGLAQEVKRAGLRLLVLDPQPAAIPRLGGYMKAEHPYVPLVQTDNILLRCADSRAFLAGIGLAGQILPTPGHSDDSVSLVLDGGAAFTGDLPPPWATEDDPANPVLHSWAALRAAGATNVHPGHGPVYPLP